MRLIRPTGGVTGLVTAYAAVFRQRRLLPIAAGVLVYGFVFVVIPWQDYDLLTGSRGLLPLLGIVMLLPRRLRWYDGARNAF